MAKSLATLQKEHGVDDFFDYICATWLNGQQDKALNLYKEMKTKDKQDFMIELDYCTFTDTFGDGPWQMELLEKLIRLIKW